MPAVYFAVMGWVPAVSSVRLHVGTVPSADTVLVQELLVTESVNVTVPVGSGEPAGIANVGVMTAVKLTAWFTIEGLGWAVGILIVVVAALTV